MSSEWVWCTLTALKPAQTCFTSMSIMKCWLQHWSLNVWRRCVESITLFTLITQLITSNCFRLPSTRSRSWDFRRRFWAVLLEKCEFELCLTFASPKNTLKRPRRRLNLFWKSSINASMPSLPMEIFWLSNPRLNDIFNDVFCNIFSERRCDNTKTFCSKWRFYLKVKVHKYYTVVRSIIYYLINSHKKVFLRSNSNRHFWLKSFGEASKSSLRLTLVAERQFWGNYKTSYFLSSFFVYLKRRTLATLLIRLQRTNLRSMSSNCRASCCILHSPALSEPSICNVIK